MRNAKNNLTSFYFVLGVHPALELALCDLVVLGSILGEGLVDTVNGDLEKVKFAE
jgi:hypothetical protein